jgi:hypothetical protein
METPLTLPILKKLGQVLLVVGILDIGLMFWTISKGGSYSSSLNIFAVIAGFFLIRGNIRTAVLVRFFSAFFLATFAGLMIFWPLIQPLGLTIEQFRGNLSSAMGSLVFSICVLGLFAWLLKNTNTPELRDAQIALGRKWTSIKVPIALGFALVLILFVVTFQTQRSVSGQKAIEMARIKHGSEYEYYVSALGFSSSSGVTTYKGEVTAWKRGSIRLVPFEWAEK